MTKISQITLTELIKALPDGQNGKTADTLRRAFSFALTAHGNERRPSGEAYIDHDLAVAHIIAQLGVDLTAITASLLHDILAPHTGKSLEEVEDLFGGEVASLVAGLNSLHKYAENKPLTEEEAEEKQQEEIKRRQEEGKKGRPKTRPRVTKEERWRAGILAIIEGDIRVILIRMADCLQDLRKASQLSREEQIKIANEARQLYAPLANRLGVWQLKWELEDLAFRYLETEAYKEIASQVAARRAERARTVNAAIRKLQNRLDKLGFEATVTGRPKHLYSIYRKMQRKKLSFDEIYDIHALRVILEPNNDQISDNMSAQQKDDLERNLCYQVLGIVHGLWKPIPQEFDDYIAAPKPNGYKSLHTAVRDPETGDKLEVQIRSVRMHEEAERGIAAHWAYKEDETVVTSTAQKRLQNLRELLRVLRDPDTPLTDEDSIQTEMAAERIHVYTPKGDVYDLPVGATPIDFAYQIHTEVGHRCRGARVEGKMVSLDYKLKRGQKVEILTANRGGPSRDWMNPNLGYTGSARTRSKIRQWFRQQEREQNVEQGRDLVERELRRLGLSDTYTVEDIAEALKYDDVDQFLAKVGFGDIHSKQISGAISLLRQSLKPDDELQPLLQPPAKESTGLKVQGMSDLPTKMAGCCNPIAPEVIIGYITRGRGVTIHRRNCKQIRDLEPERLIDVEWGETDTYPVPIVVKAYRRPNLVDEMAAILHGQKINVSKTKMMTSRSIVTVYLVVEVSDLDQLNWLLDKFEKLTNVIEAYRQRWS
jgi:GTP diphosphokinase / guanosine-3',5'-bis(diphosphate) 3'-diphosphatase